ncbi:MAG: hypothetical protein M3352_04120 [Bacteroidota bacterium]|nr:hypothetical protein [Bacteroidota bacterium]
MWQKSCRVYNMKLFYLILTLMVISSCANDASTKGKATSDTSMKSIDSSAIINDTTRLPKDSTNVGVTH